MTAIDRRDYSLVGKDAEEALAKGLASAEWYRCPVPRKELKELMKRSDGPAIRDTMIWLGALAVSGALGVHFWGTWAAVPFFLVYGVLYGSAGDSRWHECGHGTAFKTRWMDDSVYHLASFFMLREPTIWRWSHTRHHTDTIVVGRDPEIASPRPPNFPVLLLNFLAIPNAVAALRKLALHATGRLSAEEETFVPEMERSRVFLVARIWFAIFAGVALACVLSRSILPAMLVGLPTIYGGWFSHMVGLTQHAGLAEDVLDHRLNSRTVYMNPVFRFLYWNMNYHVEHHMFPMAPYHALPRLHEAIKADCPPPYPSTWAAYREIVPALLRQARDPRYHVKRELPAGASAVPHDFDHRSVAAG
ncbi:MAG: fatty acid desaturase family protein [Hyphomicrobiales bacterium]|nr:fatty acid desaturase family protein [Hyphomicrobiales bacterium]MDE2017385.1 fatty acid desaturase family protein [Hyphomicrobiales bacterium]